MANAAQLVIVTALADPEPRHGLIDRALVAAYDAGMTPLLACASHLLVDLPLFGAPVLLLGGAMAAIVRGERRRARS